MRNVLVVLVLSCIGLSCGFIVPSGIREIGKDSYKSIDLIKRTDIRRSNLVKRKTPTSHLNFTIDATPINKNENDSRYNNTMDIDLYENNVKKEGNIEERSFIYIKQKFKTPYIKNAFQIIHKNNKNKADISYTFPYPFLNQIWKKQFSAENEILHQSTFEIQTDEQTDDKTISTENDKLAVKEGIRDDYLDDLIRDLLEEQVTQTKRKILERKLNICHDCVKKKKMQSLHNALPIDTTCICRHKKITK